ncbi:hypothetical protein [Brevibacterium casei]
MLVDLLKNPLQVARLGFVIDNLEALAGRVADTDSITQQDVDNLTELVDHLNDFRPGGRKED